MIKNPSSDEDISDEPEAFDEEEDLALELAAVRRLLQLVGRMPWFSRMGLPLEASDEDMARAYLDYLGFPEIDIVLVDSFEAAEDAASTLDVNAPAWEAEEQLRAALTQEAAQMVPEDELAEILQYVNSAAAESATEAIEQVLPRLGPMPEDLATSAIGASVKAAHLAALLLLADDDADHHAFAYQFKLFELGRWPVAITGNSFFLF
ncbi:MAG: hypothetical protein AAF221_15865 [Pseudomonadota bacterium]